ncbi:MAG: hypothetical protein CVU63_10345, partial [Deltaproteobacteria bacterium HGW-Deltaproteobacteria-20]
QGQPQQPYPTAPSQGQPQQPYPTAPSQGQPQQPYPTAPSQGQPQPQPHAPSAQHKTMLGVAMPGIAPNREPAPQPIAPPYPVPDAPPPPAAYGSEPSPKRKQRAAQTSPMYRRLAFVLALLGVSVIVVVGLFALLWPTKPPISSQALVNEEGKDVLRLTCVKCPDGTVMTVEAVTATVTATVADVALPRPLAVGDNRFQVKIDRPGSGRDESVELSMPVAFRVRPDLTGLTGSPPTFHVEVEAMPETSILVDGVAVQADAGGKARYPVDVSEACSGPNAEVATIDRKLSYTIQPKGSAPSSGTVAVKVGVTSLTLQAPRPHMVVDTESFLVAGRAPRGAVVEIEGSRFDVGGDGSFSRRMQIKRVGETTVRVRAVVAEHAPRTISFTVKRVENLEEEGKAFEARAGLDARAVMEDAQAHRGKEVVLRGEVVEARSQGFVRVILLDASGTCSAPPCLARLVYAGPESLAKGNPIRVFGRVAGAQAAGGKSVPEVDVDFLLKGR